MSWFNWHRSEDEKHEETPFFMDVKPAPLPSDKIAQETKETQIELVHTLFHMARQGAVLRSSLSRNTLSRLDGRFNIV